MIVKNYAQNKSQTLFSANFWPLGLYQAKRQFKLSYILSPQSNVHTLLCGDKM
jgi:hypothetical protein